MIALVIPVHGPLVEVDLVPDSDLPGARSSLAQLQDLVGGMIEAVDVPDFIGGGSEATAYLNEEGKLLGLPPNMRATDFLVPGVGLHWNDYVAGPLVLCGFDLDTGKHRELPPGVVARARLIEQEAGSPPAVRVVLIDEEGAREGTLTSDEHGDLIVPDEEA